MKLQVCGYNIVRNGELAILHCIDLTKYNNTEGYRPFVVQRMGKVQEGLWVSTKQISVSKDLINKVLDVSFNANGRVQNIEVTK